MLNFEEALIAAGVTPEPKYACVSCDSEVPAFALSVDGPDDIDAPICTNCIIDNHRESQAAAEAEETAKLEPWATPLADYVRAERNRRIDAARWAIDPLTSPLTEACQAAFVSYIQDLHRLTIDFDHPEAITWPTEPTLNYEG